MTMNKNLVSFTWSLLRLSSLCGLALALTVMTPAKTAKACYQTYWLYGSYCLCQTSSSGYTSCTPGGLRNCQVSGSCN